MSIYGLLQNVRQRSADTQRERTRRYREILSRGDEATAAELAELDGLMEALSRTPSDVESDLRALEQHAKLTRIHAEKDAREKEAAAATAAFSEWTGEKERAYKESVDRHEKLRSEMAIAQSRQSEALQATSRIQELERANPRLFV